MAIFPHTSALRWIAAGFALFIVAVIVLANLGLVGMVFGWLYDYPNGDKIGHFFMMGILAMLVSLSFPTNRVRLFRISTLKSSLVIASLVTIEETAQLFFPDRSASFLDLAASLAGIFLFGELGVYIKMRFNSHQKGI